MKDLHSIKRVERVIGRKNGWVHEDERDKNGEKKRRIEGEDENGENELLINSIDGK